MVPVLVNAPDFLRNVVSAMMPFFVPRITRRAIESEGIWSMPLCCAYVGHSQRMCSLIWKVVLSHWQVLGSSRWGKNLLWNSPV